LNETGISTMTMHFTTKTLEQAQRICEQEMDTMGWSRENS
jgi:hypothetical protein